jgi:diguanylate cyclase (GGDEF)-like protein
VSSSLPAPLPRVARPQARDAWGHHLPGPVLGDAFLLTLLFLGTYLTALSLDGFEWLHHLAEQHEDWQVDEILTALVIAPVYLTIFLFRRLSHLRRETWRRRAAEAEASLLARHDPLTGLANRRRLAEELAAALGRARRDGGAIAVLLVDLDRFKPVNDLRGHGAGDRLLQMVAERLQAERREVDTVARLGGDEFVILAHLPADSAGPSALARALDPVNAASRIARRVVMALERPFDLRDGGPAVTVGASVGVTTCVGGTDSAEELLRQADMAMYRAKSEGRGCFRFFGADMDLRLRERAQLEADLRDAVARDALEPHFQPLVAFEDGQRLLGFEMLARWSHPQRGMVPPAEFIPLAEDTGLIVPLTAALLRRGCAVAMGWPAHLRLSVNISALHLRDRDLPALVARILAETGLPPGRLEIELTESALVDNFEMARELMNELKALGVSLALDDFGTGYSSLRHLQTLPFDKIKVDSGFVRDMMESAESSKIVAAVIALGHSLGLPTVAEGVEDEATATLLSRMGCDIGQGWLFGRPADAEAAGRLAAGSAARPDAA